MIDEQWSKVHEAGILEAQFGSVGLDRDSYCTENDYERNESCSFFTGIILCQLNKLVERVERVDISYFLAPVTRVTTAGIYRK
jgi:hypothetical protein